MSDYCQLCNTANGAHTHYCPENPANERSELASATGYALRLSCPDCGADEWKESHSGNECCVCAKVFHRNNIYSTSYLLGYHRGLKAHNTEVSDGADRKDKS